MANEFVDLDKFKFEYILNNIVSIRIPDEDLGVLGNFGGEFNLLFLVGPINALLHHATAMFVTSDLYTLIDHCVIDELVVFRRPAAQYLLDHVVPIDVFSQFPHFGF